MPPIRDGSPSNLTVNGIAVACDLDRMPCFGWHVSCARQSAYAIRVSSSQALAEAGVADVWQTGKVISTQQNDVCYVGPTLALAQRYFWTVRIWDGDDQASPWAPIASFGTGPGNNWVKSSPIWAPAVGQQSTRVDWAFLRKTFVLANHPVAWATVFATATSPLPSKQYVYKLYLNGKFVGLGPTCSVATECRFDGFDVTSYLDIEGPNVLAVVAYTTSGHAFQAELVVMYEDDRREIVGTDRTWKAQSGELAFPFAGSCGTDYYSAPKENLDARQYPFGFDVANFIDDDWSLAIEKAPFGPLMAAPMDKVKEQCHAPVTILETAPGTYFVDFGRTWVGGVCYDISAGVENETIDVRLGEITLSETTVRYHLNAGNVYQDVYTMRRGEQTFRTWGMRVFRYVEIVGAPEPITAHNLKALALAYPLDVAAVRLDTSDDALQKVWQLAKNTIEAHSVNCYTDSWTRERTNYEADAYLQLLSTLYLSTDLSLGRYSIDYFTNHRTWPTEWPMYVILAVHDLWLQSGAIQQVRDVYPHLKAKLPDTWFDDGTQLICKRTGHDGSHSVIDCDLVDWPPSQRDGYAFRPYNTVVNALSYRAYANMATLASALGRTADAATYAGRADALNAAINARLYSKEMGCYDDGMDLDGQLSGHYSLHASAFALAFGLPNASEAPRVAEYLRSRGMACSVYGALFLLRGLFQVGSGRAALALLTSSGLASWLNMIRVGAGATAEAWDSSMKDNLTYCHPWAASPTFLVPFGLFGIRPLEAGCATVQIKPQPGNLRRASITVPTVRGTLEAAFDNAEAGAFELTIRIPGNTQADVGIPVREGTTTVYVDSVAHSVTPQDGYAYVPVLGTGCHVVSTFSYAVAPS